jgi:excisionase family DNA binding protein
VNTSPAREPQRRLVRPAIAATPSAPPRAVPNAPSERLTLTVEEVHERTGVPAGTVRGWIRRGVIPSIRIGGRRLIRVADLDALIANGSPREAK